MKKIIFLIAVVGMMSLSCKSKKYISFTYSVLTRGYKLETVVTKDSTFITQSGRESKKIVKETSKDLWNNLIDETKKLDLNTIANLESPTNKRQFDAAMFAKVIVTTKDSVYTSSSFDAGHPNQTIEPLVNLLVDVSNQINEK